MTITENIFAIYNSSDSNGLPTFPVLLRPKALCYSKIPIRWLMQLKKGTLGSTQVLDAIKIQ